MIGMDTYDELNGASAQSCKTDRFTVCKFPCLPKQSIAGQIVAGTCIFICKALRGCFTFISMLKATSNSRQVSVNLLRLVIGRNVNGNVVKAAYSETMNIFRKKYFLFESFAKVE